ncbi:MAG TPA: BTAD domain-containing putative transcriptional regulator [Candidatus Limnocylindrales bacterium]|nr:BTAD domain-containing putative transcriptional regulator [Candidatus Limnocylindrales bacterium]
MDIRVLGPVEVHRHGAPLDLPRRQQRLIIGILAIDVGRIISTDRLIDILWGDRPPAQARAVVHTRISEIRSVLAKQPAPARPGAEVLLRKGQGYQLELAADCVDAHRFTTLLEASRESGSDEAASAALQSALHEWRGPVLGGWLPISSHASGYQSLELSRITALEDFFEVELRLGRHREIVDKVTAACTDEVGRERLTASAMLALHRCARTPEALQVYERHRRWVQEELGIDPGHEVEQLFLSILQGDPGLIAGAEAFTGAAIEPTAMETVFQQRVPNTLPTEVPDFTGRDKETARMVQLLTGDGPGVSAVAVSGTAGVGKTALSIHVAHRLREFFPHGQLYADLHGVDAEHTTAAAEVLARFLRALGVSSSMPDTLDERVDLYRALLADKRILVVLDNAATTEQITPLIPGSSSCGLIVNSRGQLGAALGIETVDLNILDTAQSLGLLSRIADAERVQAEPDAARALAGICGGLPLAIRIAAAKLTAKPHWTVSQMVDRLNDERRRLDNFVHEHLDVRMSISLSYVGLPLDAQRLLRRLGDVGNPEVTVWCAAALLDAPIADAEEVLEQLYDAQLLDIAGREANGYARYRLHDLVRLYAAEMVAEEPERERTAARSRILGAWLCVVEEAQRLTGSGYMSVRSTAPRWPVSRQFLTGMLVIDPLRWFDNERRGIVHMVRRAARDGFSDQCWDLAVASSPLFQMRSCYDDWPVILEIAFNAANSAIGRAAVLGRMAVLSADHLAQDQARQQLQQAAELFEKAGHSYGLATVTANLAVIDRFAGRRAEALAGLQRALPGLCDSGDRIGEVFVLRNIAQAQMDEGDQAAAEEFFDRALELAQRCESPRVEAQVQFWRGMLRQAQQRYPEAEQLFTRVLDMASALGDQAGKAQAMRGLALCHKAAGQPALALSLLSQALPLVSQPRPTRIEAMIRRELAALSAERPAQARADRDHKHHRGEGDDADDDTEVLVEQAAE